MIYEQIDVVSPRALHVMLPLGVFRFIGVQSQASQPAVVRAQVGHVKHLWP